MSLDTLDNAFALPLAKLETLGQLINCVEPARWDSLARPSAQGLAALIFGVHAELAERLADHAD